MRRKNNKINGFNVFVVFFICLVVLAFGTKLACQTGGFGPSNTVTAKVLSKHVDVENKESHFMVYTDQGAFEVDNGYLLQVWNADEVYGAIEIGKQYIFETKGSKHTNYFIQVYPYIVSYEEVQN